MFSGVSTTVISSGFSRDVSWASPYPSKPANTDAPAIFNSRHFATMAS